MPVFVLFLHVTLIALIHRLILLCYSKKMLSDTAFIVLSVLNGSGDVMSAFDWFQGVP